MIGSCVVLYQKDLLQISIIYFIHFFILRWEIPPTYVNAFYDVARNKMGNFIFVSIFEIQEAVVRRCSSK